MEVEADELLELSVAGRTLRVTPEHPFLIAPGTFRLARFLKPGDLLYIYQDGHICPARLASVRKLPLTTHYSLLTPRKAYHLPATPARPSRRYDVVVHHH